MAGSSLEKWRSCVIGVSCGTAAGRVPARAGGSVTEGLASRLRSGPSGSAVTVGGGDECVRRGTLGPVGSTRSVAWRRVGHARSCGRSARGGRPSCSERPRLLGVASTMGQSAAFLPHDAEDDAWDGFGALRMRPRIMLVGLPARVRRWRQSAQVFTGRFPVDGSARLAGVSEAVSGPDFRL